MIDSEADCMVSVILADMRASGIDPERRDPIPVNVHGVDFYLRPMSVVDRMKFIRWGNGIGWQRHPNYRELFAVVMFSLSVCDERGRLLFDLDNEDDAEQVNQFDPWVVGAVAIAATRLNRF